MKFLRAMGISLLCTQFASSLFASPESAFSEHDWWKTQVNEVSTQVDEATLRVRQILRNIDTAEADYKRLLQTRKFLGRVQGTAAAVSAASIFAFDLNTNAPLVLVGSLVFGFHAFVSTTSSWMNIPYARRVDVKWLPFRMARSFSRSWWPASWASINDEVERKIEDRLVQLGSGRTLTQESFDLWKRDYAQYWTSQISLFERQFEENLMKQRERTFGGKTSIEAMKVWAFKQELQWKHLQLMELWSAKKRISQKIGRHGLCLEIFRTLS